MVKSNPTEANKLRLIVITCLAHHGYRRAGTGFCKGENKFNADDFSESQLAQLGDDPRLKIKFVDAELLQVSTLLNANSAEVLDPKTSETLLDEGALVGDGLVVTFNAAVAKLEQDNKEHFTSDGKPQCDVLGKLMGKPMSASERDSLWSVFKAEQAATLDTE